MKQLVVVAALIALPLAAHAGPKEDAQAHITKATEAHQAGNFDVALTELEAAYKLDPQPDLLYAIGQVYVKLDNCPMAITYYERFLETKPGPEPTNAANEAITNCKTQVAAQPPEPVAPLQPEEPPPPPPPEPRKFDPIGTTLVGVGIASTVVGLIMYSSAVNKLDESEMAATYQDADQLVKDAHSQRNVAVIMGVAGATAITIGALHYVRFRKNEQAKASGMAITPTRSGGMVTWVGRF